jgi:calcineurin-like phosphoesterase family protein
MTFTPTFFFTADEHYGHANIIRYCNRPFTSVDQMDAEIIQRHNEIVGLKDVVIHAGDFTLSKKPLAENYIKIREIMQDRPDNPNFVGIRDV